MNDFHKTDVGADGVWRCTCGLSDVSPSEGIAIAAALRHQSEACHHCTQPFGVCQPDCPSDKPGPVFRVTSKPVTTIDGERVDEVCMCDGGGSIAHKPSVRCTVIHPGINDDLGLAMWGAGVSLPRTTVRENRTVIQRIRDVFKRAR